MSNPTRQQCGENPQKRPTIIGLHPDYSAGNGDPNGDRCVCGGIRYWHARPPHGCDDCDCTGFVKACDHAWHWDGLGFACVHCSQQTTERQALADMGEPA